VTSPNHPTPQPPARPDNPAAGDDLLRLLADLAGGGDLASQKRRLLDGIARIIGADAWSWAVTRTTGPATMPVPLATLEGGFSPEQKARHVRSQQSPHRRVFAAAIRPHFDEFGHFAFARPDLLTDDAWRTSDYYRQFVGPNGFDEFVLCAKRLTATDVSGLSFYRTSGKPPFGPEQCRTVARAIHHVPWLHAHATPAAAVDPLTGLAPRERQVVQLLQAGEGRKAIASRLGITEHTVGGYVKRIYRHYDVNSRGELLARHYKR
jgi:DNA-binding CsgD family transcriptional regulator